jgi:hypothetical protein
VIERLSQLHGVDLRPAAAIIQVHLQDAVAFDQKADDSALPLFKAHTGQTAAVAQKHRTFEDVRGFKPLGLHLRSPPLAIRFVVD